MPLRSINPATGEVFHETEELSPAQIEKKLADAEGAFGSWRETPFSERARLMKAAGAHLRAKKDEFAKLMSMEMGKTLAAAEGEVEKCASVCDYYADNAETFLAPEMIATNATESFVRFDPLGIVLAVMPWNFPFWQVFRFAAPALMAGNVGILKHASNVQMCAAAIEETFSTAGFPKGVFCNLAIPSSAVAAIVRDKRVKAVTLTGSEKAGSEVAKVAGEELKKTVLELGGSDPFIVLADADIEAAAATAVLARLQANAGQSCVAAKRFIVQESVADAFTKNVVAGMEKLRVGNPLDASTDVGPLATAQIVGDVERQVNESVRKGAKVLTGGKRADGPGYFYMPTVLAHVKKGMAVYEEEVFGPVLPIIVVKDVDQAVAVANDSPYGLGGTIFSGDPEAAKRLAARIESGTIFINQHLRSDIRLPFGGVKRSGYGRELSHYGIKEFVNIKTVSRR